MENLVWLSRKGKEAMEEELIRGRDMANQLLEVLTLDDKSNVIREVKGSNSKSSKVLPLDVAQDLVREVLKSLTNTLLLLHNKEDSNDVPIAVRDFSLTTSCHKMVEDLDGAYKQLKTLKTKSPKGSKKRKLSAPTWEKTTSVLIEDGHTWRKYGQKTIANSKYFRSYYRCTHSDQHCEAMKHVQRIQENPPLYRTTCYGHHTCKSYFQSNIISEPVSSSDSSILLSFDNTIQSKEEDMLWPSPLPPLSPLRVSSEGNPVEVMHDDHFLQNQWFLPENLQLWESDAYLDYLRYVNVLSSSESF
ncbi:WRKY DNA-binding transcription factor 70-like [Vicia villosa]|uniref:WRKY DNA-binding transcription factor 70-like n=1 Tax=Vicia villosa TaxID=3911 RepID=UPI00273B3C1F|nr:WRKY DNA-binding transcription factor 70-like [Vicia villosa]